jgi:8-oxo-dGTP diphosphatase
MQNTIFPMAYIVLYEGGKFLLTQRRADEDDDPAFDKKWQLPGGGLELGEHMRDLVKREAKEELGIDVDLKRTLAITELIAHREDWQRLCMAFLCRRVNPDQSISVNHESYAAGWYSIEEAKALDLMPQTLEILEYIARNYRLFKIGVLAVIRNDEGKFLLTKIQAPGKKKAHGKWSFMLGTCDINESLTDALIREVKEETNLDVSLVRPLAHTIEMFDLKILSYLVTPTYADQEVKLNYEASESGWFSYEEAIHLDLYGDTAKILEEAGKRI